MGYAHIENVIAKLNVDINPEDCVTEETLAAWYRINVAALRNLSDEYTENRDYDLLTPDPFPELALVDGVHAQGSDAIFTCSDWGGVNYFWFQK